MTTRITLPLLVWISVALFFMAPFAGAAVDEWYLPHAASNWFRIGSWLASLGAAFGIVVAAGYYAKGRVLGVLVDNRNRYSLSRLQILLWTVMVLTSLYVAMATNAVQSDSALEPLDLKIPWQLISLMGLSVASFVGSPMALSVKAQRSENTEELAAANSEIRGAQRLEDPVSARGQLMVKQRPRDARLADLIKGEETGNATTVDVTRLQMLAITLIVYVVFGVEMLNRFSGTEAIDGLPELSQSLLGLILVSHGGYLTGKLIPNSRSTRSDATRLLAKSTDLSRRSERLVFALERGLDTSLRARKSDAANLLAYARTLAAKVAAFPAAVADGSLEKDTLATVEGQLIALEARARELDNSDRGGEGVDDPHPEDVARVQRALAQRGYQVEATGLPDAATLQAATDVLQKHRIKRKDLSAKPDRFYEELSSLLDHVS